MLIIEKYCGIYYDIITNGKRSTVMEFVEFAENTEGGVYVKEGWGSVKDNSYYGLKYFQANDEKTFEESQTNGLLSYSIPTNDDLKVKYPITYPTSYTAEEEKKLEIILEGFDSWNNGIEAYKTWVDKAYDKDAKSTGLNEIERTMDQFKEEMEQLCNEKTIKKLRFDNVLIREDWAAIHYRYRIENENYVGDRMQFLKFQEKDGTLKIVASWTQ